MTKITVKYDDGLVNTMIIPETESVAAIINEIVDTCRQHNTGPPEFSFDDWETNTIN